MGSYNANYIVTSRTGERCVLRVPLRGIRELDLRVLSESEVLSAFETTADASPAPRILGTGPSGAMLLEFVGDSMLEDAAPKGEPIEPFELDQLISAFGWLHADDRGLGARFRDNLSKMKLSTETTMETNRNYLLRVWKLIWSEYASSISRLGLPAPEDLASVTKTMVPIPRRATLLHGDVHRKNVRTDRGRQRISIIDWEMAQVGDPLYDIAVAAWKMKLPEAQFDCLLAGWVDQLPADYTKGWRRDLPGYIRLETIKTACVHFLRAVDSLSESTVDLQKEVAAEYATNLNDAADFLPNVVTDEGTVLAALCEACGAASPDDLPKPSRLGVNRR